MKNNHYILFAVGIFLFIIKCLYFYLIPEYTIDSIWTACGGYANLRGEYLTDKVTGFRFLNLYSYLVTFFLYLSGNTSLSLHFFYAITSLSLFLTISYNLVVKKELDYISTILLSSLFITDLLIQNERLELICILFLTTWFIQVKEFQHKHFIGSLISFLLHPVAFIVYLYIYITNNPIQIKNIFWSIFLICAILFIFKESTLVWLETIGLIGELKYILLFQIAISFIIYSNQKIKPYISRIIPLVLLMILVGKPYYFAYINFYSLFYILQCCEIKKTKYFIGSATFFIIINLYIGLAFPFITNILLNKGYSQHLEERNNYLQNQSLGKGIYFVPVDLSVPFLINKSKVYVYDPHHLNRILNNLNKNEVIYTESLDYQLHDVIDIESQPSAIKEYTYVQYNLLLQKEKSITKGLYKLSY
ncbi:MAG: hypothetical protein HYZ42_00110 [Bacteroidetes bacterium]|nr:hypothetical protein [Bacteroidota bacterium]